MKIDWKRIGIKELAALTAGKLQERGIDVILVGGACVSIYTKNRYQSYDLDFITYATMKDVAFALAELCFLRESSRHFVRRGCPYYIEFVVPPAAIGGEPLKGEKEMKTRFGKIILLTPTASVKDRLAAYYHWNDPQALEQALMVALAQEIDLQEVKRWSAREGHEEKYREFMKRLKNPK